MPSLRLLPLAAAMFFVLASASPAHAGQYTLAYDFASDLSGWSGYVEPGYLLCGPGATAGCPDVSTNRIMARAGGAQAIWSQGRWEWTAPPGTLIVGGSLAYRTRMRHAQFFARVKMRADGVTWDAAPALVSEQQTTALTDHVIALAGGFRQIGVALYAHPGAAGLVTDPWDDYVTLVRLVVTVEDAQQPALAWVDGGGLLDGAWHRGDVCATLGLGDHESGAGAVWLVSGNVSAAWNAAPTGSQYQPAAPYAQPGLCLSAAALGDGIHAGAVGGADASGGQATPLPFTVRIDTTAPSGAVLAPSAVAAEARPPVELAVSDATSGVAAVAATIDGAPLPLALAGGSATGRPAAALAFGGHTLAWSVADAAGNRGEGSMRFDVADTKPPAFGAPQPPNGAALAADEILSVTVAVGDDGSGVDPAATALTLDGAPLDHVWQVDGIVHGVAGARLAAGVHHLVLKVADRAGNAGRLAWDVTVASGAAAPAGSAPAGGSAVAGGTAGAAPGLPARVARTRASAVRAVRARVGAVRPRVVIVHLRASARFRFVLRLRCGATVRTLRARASARGIAIVRVACAGAATVRMATPPARLLVRIAPRRLPLRLVAAIRAAVCADGGSGQWPPGRAPRPRGRARGAHGARLAARGPCSRRRLRALRDLVRDRARRPVRRARPGARHGRQPERALRADDALSRPRRPAVYGAPLAGPGVSACGEPAGADAAAGAGGALAGASVAVAA